MFIDKTLRKTAPHGLHSKGIRSPRLPPAGIFGEHFVEIPFS